MGSAMFFLSGFVEFFERISLYSSSSSWESASFSTYNEWRISLLEDRYAAIQLPSVKREPHSAYTGAVKKTISFVKNENEWRNWSARNNKRNWSTQKNIKITASDTPIPKRCFICSFFRKENIRNTRNKLPNTNKNPSHHKKREKIPYSTSRIENHGKESDDKMKTWEIRAIL
jgi:hypothetical protein